MKFVIVTGGTVSGLGKGTAISSLGVLLQGFGYPVTAIKIDPYLNLDAGTMSPYEHGEVFVLEDGGECDLDLGNYERFLDITLTREHNITTGKMYSSVFAKERKGEYLGKTVQVVPHVTNEIQERILRVANADEVRFCDPAAAAGQKEESKKELIVLVELGGTVGDIESAVYLEALQQFQTRLGTSAVCVVHVGYVPSLNGEEKTKPCQHSVKLLREAGLKPDLLFCRSEDQLENETLGKLCTFCQVPFDHVISLYNVGNTYQVPFLLAEQNCGENILRKLGLTWDPSKFKQVSMCQLERLPAWREKVELADGLLPSPSFSYAMEHLMPPCSRRGTVKILIVGKYVKNVDSYLSVMKALQHAALWNHIRLFVEYLDAKTLETYSGKIDSFQELRQADGILVPGGFGDRGVEGKIECARFCMNENKPYLGICLGLQTAVIMVARDRLGWTDANSTEFQADTSHPVVIHMPEIKEDGDMGGTMRLGSRPCFLADHSKVQRMHGGRSFIMERHRHRYEINPKFVPLLEGKCGVWFSGKDDTGQRMEIMEMKDHPFFVGSQFHPEFTSRVGSPNMLFSNFLITQSMKKAYVLDFLRKKKKAS